MGEKGVKGAKGGRVEHREEEVSEGSGRKHG